MSTGYDGISSIVVRAVSNLISTPLSNVINNSLINGIFPNDLKIGKIIPVFKSGVFKSQSVFKL